MAEGMLGGNQGSGGNMIGTILQVLNNQPGGLSGMLQSLQQGGLGGAVSSWIGSGQNTPVSAGQIQSALSNEAGGGLLEELASKLGVSPEVASSHLAEHLPNIVDGMTPDGAVPEGGFKGAGLSMLEGFAKRFSA